MYDNYIFDFGNVIAEFNPDKITMPYASDPETRKIVSEIVFDRKYWDRLDRGTISDEEVKADIKTRLGGELSVIACTVYDNWIANLSPIDGVGDIIFDLKKSGKKLYLLSDISVGFANNYHTVPWINELLSCFDGLVLSAIAGNVKPEKEIFEYLISHHDLVPSKSVFIDDRVANIEGAALAGIDGYVFDGNSLKLRTFLGI